MNVWILLQYWMARKSNNEHELISTLCPTLFVSEPSVVLSFIIIIIIILWPSGHAVIPLKTFQ